MARMGGTAPAITAPVDTAPVGTALPDLEFDLGSFTGPIEVQHTGAVTCATQPPVSLNGGEVRRALPGTDLVVSPLALGCSVFGWTTDGDTSMSILDTYRDLGGNFLDTADSYASGRSEVLLGSWLRSRSARDSTVVATKIGRNRDFAGLGARSIVGAVHSSLERLGTDYIDVLYFHYDDTSVLLEESLGAVDVLMKAGKVRALAASNFSAERLMEARVLAANGLPKFVALQTQYSLVHRAEFESSLELVTRAQGMPVLPYFALAHGFLAGTYRTKGDVAADERGRRIVPYLNRRTLRVVSALERIADAHDAVPATIALAWLLARGMLAPVTSVSRAGQLADLMGASRLNLTRSEMHDLDRVSL
ncbi:aldo/keto reductase [Glaciibacter psychrotolerans]|uniref:Aryl-alcohol dehydrogenase-like predicted oxidoreductase n=1 Tax=Glaciibacter psychrotolerans TaxID=670054 RepID=A0A7Z0J6H3_9MICO|nr:aldo/keto reductase [Leifsonia psychrotolerans]NYJ19943.1 aryl-alcohol dehydrogenase-like predicted oxidoreductase [Leifsonia psychrotolerans]